MKKKHRAHITVKIEVGYACDMLRRSLEGQAWASQRGGTFLSCYLSEINKMLVDSICRAVEAKELPK